MPTIDTILDNISQYRGDIDNLFRQLKALGISSLDDLRKEARLAGVAIPQDIQKDVEVKFQSSDPDDWRAAQEENTIEAYQRYMDEHPDGAYRANARAAKERLVAAENDKKNATIWEELDKNSIEALSGFIEGYPNDPHIPEAKKLLKDLRKEEYFGVDIKALAKRMKDIEADGNIMNPQNAIFTLIENYVKEGKILVKDLIEAISLDHNFISSRVAYMLWEKNILTDEDYLSAGIDEDFIAYMLANRTPQRFSRAKKLEQVTKVPCTEIYFWGIPSSGKSCALGGILSAAGCGKYALSMSMDNNCQGYGYMNRLSNLFRTNNQVGALPEGTPTTSTYEMGFNLEDSNGRVHPITCIDLAGELIRCMYKKDAGEDLREEEQEVLETLTKIMVDNRTKNRKIHFFVIEYGAEDREYEGLPQGKYLQAATRYIERTGIFKKDTDGLYLVISKVDKAKAKGSALTDKLKEYIESNYLGFYNGLKKICKDNEINGGNVTILPFTLGDVCFQNYCKFKDKTAAKVVEEVMARSYGYNPGRWAQIENRLAR